MPDMPSKDAFLAALPYPLALAFEEACTCADYDLMWSLLQANQAFSLAMLKAQFPEASWKNISGD